MAAPHPLLHALLDQPLRDLIVPILDPISLLRVASCAKMFYQSDLISAEGRKRYPVYFFLYDLSTTAEIAEGIHKISLHKLFGKAYVMHDIEKVQQLMGTPSADAQAMEDIWSKNPDDPNEETYSKSSSTVYALIQRLTSRTPDIKLASTVLRTFPYYCTFEQLLSLLFARYKVPAFGTSTHPDLQGDQATYTKAKKEIQLRVVNFLRKLVMQIGEYFLYYDDNGKQLKQFLKSLDEVILSSQDSVPFAKFIKTSLIKRALLEVTLPYEPPLFQNKPTQEIKTTSTLDDFDATTIAHQLILIDFRSLCNIKVPELLNQNWAKKHKAQKAPNVLNQINLFNAISRMARCWILGKDELPKRAKVLEKLIYTAEEAWNKNGFGVTVALMAGMNDASVHRLKHTWEVISKKAKQVYAEVSRCVSYEKSYKTMREAMKIATPPCLPYLGMPLTDLTFIEDGQGDYTPAINLRKCELISDAISSVEMYTHVPFEFAVNTAARNFVLHELTKQPDDDTYNFERSLRLEPRGM